jgi:hypothetical protein
MLQLFHLVNLAVLTEVMRLLQEWRLGGVVVVVAVMEIQLD